MAFDTQTRNRLAKFVAASRKLLCGDFNSPGGEVARLLAHYGIQVTGECAELEKLSHLDEREKETARTLRAILEHKRANAPKIKVWRKFDPVVYDLVQEQGFTALNRLCALRMAEERQLVFPCVSKGLQSDGFQLYEYHTSKSGEANTAELRYQQFLFSLFDELAVDLGALFDRFSPQGVLFPGSKALGELLEELNDEELSGLWSQDETIGWIYQYWNSKEERKAMRDASAAPRNSRELAVRNQFFTPRYVVEFLTDNTLGRIWYEMSGGATSLKEKCRYLVRRPNEVFLKPGESAPEENEEQRTKNQEFTQEELLKQPVHIPHRPVKDPREIRLLDPACGSMHFGLYAFDLFEAIYEEAWDKGLCPALQEAYPEKADYLRDVPRLIIEHNIHGVDIDPRAVQIAGLSLWLRAQKTWKDTPAAERPRVRRSNIVCAEPMPGSDAMLEDFLQTLDPPLLGELVKTVFDKMQLAGEAGALLKIEEEIRTAIDDAKAKWEKLGAAERDLFSAEELNQTLRPGAQQELEAVDKSLLALRSLGEGGATDFFDTAEERIYAALRDYAESAETGDYQRRLFAEDAAHGFAFIDLCRQRYDAVVMNPPFGDASEISKQYIFSEHKREKTEIGACFVTRMSSMLEESGSLGIISNRTFLFANSFQDWKSIYMDGLTLCADLGFGVLDAMVETAAFVLSSCPTRRSTFFALTNSVEKPEHLFEVVSSLTDVDLDHPRAFVRNRSQLRTLGNEWFYYWIPETILQSATELSAAKTDLIARRGLQTCDNFRFLRLAWENSLSSTTNAEWFRLSKGGDYQPFWSDFYLVVFWKDNGTEVKAVIENSYHSWSKQIPSVDLYRISGLTYTERTSSSLSMRILPANCLFDKQGPFVGYRDFKSNRKNLLQLLGNSFTYHARALVDSRVGLRDATSAGSPARHYMPAAIENLPLLPLESEHSDRIQSWALLSVRMHQRLGALDVTDSLFRPWRITSDYRTIAELQTSISKLFIESSQEVYLGLAYAERCMAEAFSLTHATQTRLEQVFGPSLSPESHTLEEDTKLQLYRLLEMPESDLVKEALEKVGYHSNVLKPSHIGIRKIELAALALSLSPLEIAQNISHFSWFIPALDICQAFCDEWIGYVFGRWDIRYATGERQPPELPDPFDPLPVCPPGMLQNADGLPAAPSDVPDDYPLPITWPGILVSDPGHPEDIVARVREALAVIWGDRSAASEQEACEILGVGALRDYFAEKKSGGKFFKDHLKRYSKSRRQAPIYWPLSTESGAYTLWIYYHRLTEDTLYSAVTQFIEPKQEEAQKTFNRLNAQKTRSRQEDKELETAQLLIAELGTFRESLLEIAKFWKPNLNDGVQITAAPLWKHFRLPAWQKKLKETWKKLEAGEYDWSHLAHSIWPERVIPKCAEDRSLAIAHGYGDDLWDEVEDSKGKTAWKVKGDAEGIAQNLVKGLK